MTLELILYYIFRVFFIKQNRNTTMLDGPLPKLLTLLARLTLHELWTLTDPVNDTLLCNLSQLFDNSG